MQLPPPPAPVYKTLQAVRSHGNGAVPGNPDDTQRSTNEPKCDFFVWGSDKNGQLGQNINKKMFVAPRPCFFKGVNNVQQVSCGDSHTVILTTEGLVYSFGSNTGK